MFSYSVKEYYKFQVARHLIKSSKQLYTYSMLFIQYSYLICYFICNACLGNGHASKLYTTTILFIDDNKHAKTVGLTDMSPSSYIPISDAHSPYPLKAACDFFHPDLFLYQNRTKFYTFGPNLNHSGINSPTYFHFQVLWNKNVCLL